MSRVFVCGLGAVSPVGWTVAALREVLARSEPLPVQPLVRPGWARPLRARLVPEPVPRPAFLAHPRLRRSRHDTLLVQGLSGRESALVHYHQ